MIIDDFSRIENYKSILPHLEDGLKAIQDISHCDLNAHYPFNGGWFMVQEGITKDLNSGDFEAHRKYIDVQILLQGKEEIAWENTDKLPVSVPYDEQSDKEKRSGRKDHHILISEGMFWAAFPGDAHKAVSDIGEHHSFRKIVMKLEVI